MDNKQVVSPGSFQVDVVYTHPEDPSGSLSMRLTVSPESLQTRPLCRVLLEPFAKRYNQLFQDTDFRVDEHQLAVYVRGWDVTQELLLETNTVNGKYAASARADGKQNSVTLLTVANRPRVVKEGPPPLTLTLTFKHHVDSSHDLKVECRTLHNDLEGKTIKTLLTEFTASYQEQHEDHSHMDFEKLAVYAGNLNVTNKPLSAQLFATEPELSVRHKFTIYLISDDERLLQYGTRYPFHLQDTSRKFSFGVEGVERGTRSQTPEREYVVEYNFVKEVNVPAEHMHEALVNTNELMQFLAEQKMEEQRQQALAESEDAAGSTEEPSQEVGGTSPEPIPDRLGAVGSKPKPDLSSWMCCSRSG